MSSLTDKTPDGAEPIRPGASYALPEKPVVVIERGKAWSSLKLGDLWAYRELLYFLMWRDIKVRYKQTVLGAAWAVIQPLVLMIIFTYFFGILTPTNTEGVPHPIFFYSGLVVWTFFSNAVLNGANSLVGNTNLITKVYFPRLIIPGAAVGAGLIDFAIASTLLVGLVIYYNFPVTWGYVMLLPLVALVTLLALAISVWLSALNVKYRDVRYALPFLIQVWFFVSPILYPASLVPDQWRWVLALNPMMGVIEGFRSALFARDFDWPSLGYSAAFTTLLLVYGAYTFKRMERYFAELI